MPPPAHTRAHGRTHLRDCDVWEEEEDEEAWDSDHEHQQQQRRRRTVPEVYSDHTQQRGRGSDQRGKRRCSKPRGVKKGRGVWGGILRVLGITTTVASVVVVTGAAVFAAAALNTVRVCVCVCV